MKLKISEQKKSMIAMSMAATVGLVATFPVSAAPSAGIPPTPPNFSSLYDYAKVVNAPTGVFATELNTPNAVVDPTPLTSSYGDEYVTKTIRQPDGVPGGLPGNPCFSLTPTSGKLTILPPPAEPTGWLKVIELEAPFADDYTGKVLTINFDSQVMMSATKNNINAQDGMVFSCTVYQGESKTPCANTISYPILAKSMVYSSTSPNYPLLASAGQENRVTQMANYHGWVEFSGGSEVPRVEIKVGYLGNATNLAAKPVGGQICYGHLTTGLANKL